mmetsp:Transcript_73814/g.190498  ORF Transcript_73814/g.190498 Transcript_73814/m.190498 type:complete len:293 (+) Transcript_73814:1014-1892(+)
MSTSVARSDEQASAQHLLQLPEVETSGLVHMVRLREEAIPLLRAIDADAIPCPVYREHIVEPLRNAPQLRPRALRSWAQHVIRVMEAQPPLVLRVAGELVHRVLLAVVPHKDHEVLHVQQPGAVCVQGLPEPAHLDVTHLAMRYREAWEVAPQVAHHLLEVHVSGPVLVAGGEHLVPVASRAVPLVRGRVHHTDDSLELLVPQVRPGDHLQPVDRTVELGGGGFATAVHVDSQPEGLQLIVRDGAFDPQQFLGTNDELPKVQASGTSRVQRFDELPPELRTSGGHSPQALLG